MSVHEVEQCNLGVKSPLILSPLIVKKENHAVDEDVIAAGSFVSYYKSVTRKQHTTLLDFFHNFIILLIAWICFCINSIYVLYGVT